MFLVISILCSLGTAAILLYALFIRPNSDNLLLKMVNIVLVGLCSLFIFIGLYAIKEENTVLYKQKDLSYLSQYYWTCDGLMINPMGEVIEVKQYNNGKWVIVHGTRQIETEYCYHVEGIKK